MSNAYIGEIRMVGFNFPPRGWGSCNGAVLSIQQNTALFSLIGTNFGGNGTTTFMLPNLQSRMAIGYGAGAGLSPYTLGQVGGAQAANLAVNNLPAHNHAITGGVTVATTVGVTNTTADKIGPNGHILAPAQTDATPATPVSTYSDQAANGTLSGVASTVASTLGTALTGNGLPVPTLPPFLAINYVIVLQGLFPSRN
jgi:microcystin-dependent protein